MLEKLIYADLGYESDSFSIILKAQTDIQNAPVGTDISEEQKVIKEEKKRIIKNSGLSETEINKFFDENEIISTSPDNTALNAIIFRNKTSNEIEIAVGGTKGFSDLVEDAGIVGFGYSVSQGLALNKLISDTEKLSNGIKPDDKINLSGHSLAKGTIETTLITYFANDNNKLEQINELNYFNGVSISRNNYPLFNLSGIQDANISKIQSLYNKGNVTDIVVDTGFEMVPNALLTGLFSKTLLTEEARIGVGFDTENFYFNYNNHFLTVCYKILKADEFIKQNNLSEIDKQNLYNIYNVNFGNSNSVSLGTEIENFEKMLLLNKDNGKDLSSLIKNLDGLTNIGKFNNNSVEFILNNLSNQDKDKLNLAIFMKEHSIYNKLVDMFIHSDLMMNLFKSENGQSKLLEYINFYDKYFPKILKDFSNFVIKPIRDFKAEHKLYDPLVLDLNHDGIINTTQLTDTTTAFYDLDKDGYREQTGWVEATDGILINGLNNSVFGINGSSGYQELKSFDSNNDSKISLTDTNFQDLKIWQDYNQDGIVDEEETLTLNDLNITEINLTNTATHQIINGNTILATSTFTQDNQSYLTANVNFQINDTITKFENNYDLSNEQINLKGFGKIKDLNITTYENKDFKTWIETNLTDTTSIIKNFDLFLKKWANINSPTKELLTTTLSEKTWIVETFSDKNQLKPFIETNLFSDADLNRRTSVTGKEDILLEYENLKMNYLTQFILIKSIEENILGLTINSNYNRVEINNIYKLYSDLSNIINTKPNNEVIAYLHILKDNDLLKYIDKNLISPLIKDTYLLDVFNNNYDHIISDLNKQGINNDIVTSINNRYTNQLIYMENNTTTLKGQNKTTYLTNLNNTINTEGKENIFILKNGINTINAIKGDKVDISTDNSINTLNLSNNNLVIVDSHNSSTTLNLYNNKDTTIKSDKKISLTDDNLFGTLNNISIETSNEDDYIKIKNANQINISDKGGINTNILSFSKIANIYNKGDNIISSSNVKNININLEDGTNTLDIYKATNVNINLQNTITKITLTENVNQSITSDKAIDLYTKNVSAPATTNVNSSKENDILYLRNINTLNVSDLGGTNSITNLSINNATLNLSNGLNNKIIEERTGILNLKETNSINSTYSMYANTVQNIETNKGITLTSSSYQMETSINLNLSEEKDTLTIANERQININDLGGDNIINIFTSYNSNIKTGNGNDYINYKSTVSNTIEAGGGNDTIISSAGDDTFIFDKNHGKDTITNYGGLNDKIFIKNTLKKDISIFMKGDDLLIGTDENNSITIKSQKNINYKIEGIELDTGEKLNEIDINKLIQDINAFSVSKGIQITSEQDIRKNQDLMTLVNSSWK